MRRKTFDLDPANASLTGFASNVTGATFTLTANSSGDGLAHQVSVRNDSATDHTGKVITLVGTDENGKAQTDTVNNLSPGATVETTKYFLTLTSATPSATIGADTFDIGWVDEVAWPWIPLNWRNPNVTGIIQTDVTGTIDYSVWECFQNILAGETPIWRVITALSAKTADVAASSPSPGATGLRLVVNSYTDTAEIQMYLNQPDFY